MNGTSLSLISLGLLSVAGWTRGSLAKDSNQDVANAWARGESASSQSMSTDGYDLFSYSTLIGCTQLLGGKLVKVGISNPSRTSMTTKAKHLPAMRYALFRSPGGRMVKTEEDADVQLTIRGPRGGYRVTRREAISRGLIPEPERGADEPTNEEISWAAYGPWIKDMVWSNARGAYMYVISNRNTGAEKLIGYASGRGRVNWRGRATKEAALRNRTAAGAAPGTLPPPREG